MWLCLMDSELIKFTQEIEASHHQRDVMAQCVCVCGFTTHTHVNALSSKHKFVSNHTIVSTLHERIRGEQKLLWASLSECVCFFVCFFVFLDYSLSRSLLFSLNIGPRFLPSNLRVFLSLPPFFSVHTDLPALALFAHFTVCLWCFYLRTRGHQGAK